MPVVGQVDLENVIDDDLADFGIFDRVENLHPTIQIRKKTKKAELGSAVDRKEERWLLAP